MSVGSVKLGNLTVSRMILGGNPFSGFSHQSVEMSREMRLYFTTAGIKETFRKAEALGINTFIGRVDNHIMRVLEEYWNEGGSIQWIAQTAPELKTIRDSVDRALAYGAKAIFIHGGQMDNLIANHQTGEALDMLAYIRSHHLPAGVAGHMPEVFAWAEQYTDIDFYMCSYYNPTERTRSPGYDPNKPENYHDLDRQAMLRLIPGMRRPVIHYKILAAGRNDPREAIPLTVRHMRPQDAVCIGIYDKDHPDMMQENLRLMEKALYNT